MDTFYPIVDYEGYYVTKDGKVWSEKSNKFLSLFPDKDGYLLCSLSHAGKSRPHKVHRLVALSFLPNPENKPQVNHIDGNKANNHIDNLEWASAKENINHALNSGLINSKLSEEDVLYIRTNYIPKSPEFGCRALAKKFNVVPSVISNVVKGKTYKENH